MCDFLSLLCTVQLLSLNEMVHNSLVCLREKKLHKTARLLKRQNVETLMGGVLTLKRFKQSLNVVLKI
jgi:hypothetical protein